MSDEERLLEEADEQDLVYRWQHAETRGEATEILLEGGSLASGIEVLRRHGAIAPAPPVDLAYTLTLARARRNAENALAAGKSHGADAEATQRLRDAYEEARANERAHHARLGSAP